MTEFRLSRFAGLAKRIWDRLTDGFGSYMAGVLMAGLFWVFGSLAIYATHRHNAEYFIHYPWANVMFNVGNLMAFAFGLVLGWEVFKDGRRIGPPLYGVVLATLVFAVPMFISGTEEFFVALAVVSPICVLLLSGPRVRGKSPRLVSTAITSTRNGAIGVLAALAVALWVVPTPPLIPERASSPKSEYDPIAPIETETYETESDDYYGSGEDEDYGEECSSDYSGCVPPDEYDLDCDELGESDIEVYGDDPYGLDRDGDGIGCESW